MVRQESLFPDETNYLFSREELSPEPMVRNSAAQAALEEEYDDPEFDRLQEIELRLETEIENLQAQLESRRSSLFDAESDVDVPLAEYNLDAIVGCASAVESDVDGLEAAVITLATLVMVRDGEPVSSEKVEASGPTTLTADELPRIPEPSMERDQSDDDDWDDGLQAAFRSRIEEVSNHIRQLCWQVHEQVGEASSAAEKGKSHAAVTFVRAAQQVSAELNRAAALWVTCASEEHDAIGVSGMFIDEYAFTESLAAYRAANA